MVTATFTSASDGRTYVVAGECWFTGGDVYRIDPSISQTSGNQDKQISDNVLLARPAPGADAHYSCTSKGVDQDWCWISDEHDPPGGGNNPLRNEIYLVNVITGQVERYAHHRSDSFLGYYHQPRLQASWDGRKVLWASDGDGFSGGGGGLYVVELPVTPPLAAPTSLRIVGQVSIFLSNLRMVPGARV